MSKYAKWIAGGLGWAVGGPIGGIAGFVLGSLFDNASDIDERYRASGNRGSGEQRSRAHQETRPGDFGISLVILSAAVMKADGKVMKSELNYVKQFLVNQFGDEKAKDLVQMLREVLEHDVSVRQVCLQIKQHMTHPMRLQLLHYLVGIGKADHDLSQSEVNLLSTISRYLGISQKDFQSIYAMFGAKEDPQVHYDILEIPKSATNDEVKKAYRKMAVKYHPDKVASLGEEFQKAAKEKFQQVQNAYDSIKKERGM